MKTEEREEWQVGGSVVRDVFLPGNTMDDGLRPVRVEVARKVEPKAEDDALESGAIRLAFLGDKTYAFSSEREALSLAQHIITAVNLLSADKDPTENTVYLASANIYKEATK